MYFFFYFICVVAILVHEIQTLLDFVGLGF